MATSHALELWEQGKYLHDILGYGQEEFESILEIVMDIAKENLDDARSFVDDVVPNDKISHVMGFIDILERNSYARQFFANISPMDFSRSFLKKFNEEAVQEGSMIALGYLQPRNINDFPKPIPIDVWNGRINWKESTAHGSGLYFESVRLVDAPDIQPTARKPVGRPSREAILLKAFQWGIDNDRIELFHSKTVIYDKVREIIKSQFPTEYEEGKGLGDTPMKKYLSKRISQERLKCNS